MRNTSYFEFLKTKNYAAPIAGFDISIDDLNQHLFQWQKEVVRWALKKGKCALFLDTGLGKTICQLVWANIISHKEGMNVIIFAPLAVSHQTKKEGEKYGINVHISRGQEDVRPGINIANYEIMGKFNPLSFIGIVLDESSIIKHFGGKTASRLIDTYKDTKYKMCCTATPAPNDYMEIGMHSEFLGIMRRSEMLSTFFVHDSGDTSKWRLKGHAESKFWEWVASWACVVKTPEDLGYSSAGYVLPELKITHHIVESKKNMSDGGQCLMFAEYAKTLSDRRKARKNSLSERILKAAEIANSSNEQVLLWCDLNVESNALSKVIHGAVEVQGADSIEHKVNSIIKFVDGDIKAIVSKSSIYGFGINLQNCHKIIFVGLSDSFELYYQAIRRCYRYGQKNSVEVHVITSESEGSVKDNIERKQQDAMRMAKEMAKYTNKIMKETIYGTTRISESYLPQKKMIVPNWLEVA